MYKSLCTDGLGVSIRQNELIELALTYGYKGIEIDMDDMVGRAEKMGDEFATQFVNAANVDISTFELPIDFGATEDDYKAQAGKLEKVCELAKSIGAKNCYIKVKSTHPALQYQENFEKHRVRIAEVADKLAAVGTRIGLQFAAGGTVGDDMRFIHQPRQRGLCSRYVELAGCWWHDVRVERGGSFQRFRSANGGSRRRI